MSERAPSREQKGAEAGAEQHIKVEVHHHHKSPEAKPIDVGEARKAVHEATLKSDESPKAEHTKTHSPHQHVGQETMQIVYQRTLLKIRRHLSPPARATSKFIHQPVVEAVSEVAGKTVARPSGLLGGGFIAFIGTSAYYYMTRHYGYDYHSSVFLALLVGGFVVGWILEGFWRGFRRSK